MRHRILALIAISLVVAVIAPGPSPAAVALFDAKAFAEAQDAGRGIVVFVHAPW